MGSQRRLKCESIYPTRDLPSSRPSSPSSGATLTSSARASNPNQPNRSDRRQHPQKTTSTSPHSQSISNTRRVLSSWSVPVLLSGTLIHPPPRAPVTPQRQIHPLPAQPVSHFCANKTTSTKLATKTMCHKYYAHHTACGHESTIREYCEHSHVSSRTGRHVPCKRYTTAMAGITEIHGGVCGSVRCRVSQLSMESGTGCCCLDSDEYRRRRRGGRSGGRCKECDLRYWDDGGSGGSTGGVWIVNGQTKRRVEGRREVCSWCWGVEG